MEVQNAEHYDSSLFFEKVRENYKLVIQFYAFLMHTKLSSLACILNWANVVMKISQNFKRSLKVQLALSILLTIKMPPEVLSYTKT